MGGTCQPGKLESASPFFTSALLSPRSVVVISARVLLLPSSWAGPPLVSLPLPHSTMYSPPTIRTEPIALQRHDSRKERERGEDRNIQSQEKYAVSSALGTYVPSEVELLVEDSPAENADDDEHHRAK